MTRVDWQKALFWFAAIAASLLILAAVPIALAAPHPPEPVSAGGGRAKPCNAVPCLRDALAWQKHEVRRLRRRLAVRDQRDATYAIKLASAAFGVPAQDMRTIAQCESGMGAQVTAEAGSGASGVMQFLPSTWKSTPFARFDVFDPVANVLAAAQIVRHDHGWRQWSCSSITGVR